MSLSSSVPRTSRRILVSSGAALAVVAIANHTPSALAQTDRALLDMPFVLEQIEVVHFAALLEAFNDEAFAAAGLPEDTRSGIERMLQADSTHLARLARPEGAPLPPPVSPSFTDLDAALRDAIVLKELTGSEQLSGDPILEYFAPLNTWLTEQNKGKQCGWEAGKK